MDAVKAKNQKQAFRLVQQITKYEAPQVIVKGISNLGDSVVDEEEVNQLIAEHYTVLFGGPDTAKIRFPLEENLFSIEDVEKAIENCEFNRGLGPDMFDGNVLKNKEIKDNLVSQVKDMLNRNELPEYVKEGRMMCLSKTGKAEVELKDIRPIVI
jgi:hypothetical protein